MSSLYAMNTERIEALEAELAELTASEHSLSERCNRLARQCSNVEADKAALEAHVRDLERDPAGRSTAPIVHFLNESKKAQARVEAAEQALERVAKAVQQPDGASVIVTQVSAIVTEWASVRGER